MIGFTSKERDAETGLNFFGARYMSSAQGRFTSADPLLSSATIYNPQTWNRYSYGLNNPLKYIDPTGLYICGGTRDECKDFANALKEVQRARNSFKKRKPGTARVFPRWKFRSADRNPVGVPL